MLNEKFINELRAVKQSRCIGGLTDGKLFLSDYVKYVEYTVSHVKQNGIWLEFGVFKGSTLSILSSYTSNIIYGFDSFLGLPETWQVKNCPLAKGTFSTNGVMPPELRQTISLHPNIRIISGYFQDTLPLFVVENKQELQNIALIHIDSDLYESARIIFANLRPFIVPGVVIMFDELVVDSGFEDSEMKALLEQDFHYKYLSHLVDKASILITE